MDRKKGPNIFSEKGANRGRGTPHILSEGGPIGGDTSHQNRLPVQITSSVDGRVGGWVAE